MEGRGLFSDCLSTAAAYSHLLYRVRYQISHTISGQPKLCPVSGCVDLSAQSQSACLPHRKARMWMAVCLYRYEHISAKVPFRSAVFSVQLPCLCFQFPPSASCPSTLTGIFLLVQSKPRLNSQGRGENSHSVLFWPSEKPKWSVDTAIIWEFVSFHLFPIFISVYYLYKRVGFIVIFLYMHIMYFDQIHFILSYAPAPTF
jgi:hypothetical protein